MTIKKKGYKIIGAISRKKYKAIFIPHPTHIQTKRKLNVFTFECMFSYAGYLTFNITKIFFAITLEFETAKTGNNLINIAIFTQFVQHII